MQFILSSCGGDINSSYFYMLDLNISDCLYHLYNWLDLKKQQQSLQRKEETSNWGFNMDNDFDG